MPKNAIRTWKDEKTGREVRLLTDVPGGASLPYFRVPKHLPDGRMIVCMSHARGNCVLVDPESGDVQPLPLASPGFLQFCPKTGRGWQIGPDRRVIQVQLPDCTFEEIGQLPADIPGYPETISCDGQAVLCNYSSNLVEEIGLPRVKDAALLWRYLRRPRRGAITAYDLFTRERRTLVETEGIAMAHLDASPRDPNLLRYSEDHWDGHGQRTWMVRIDGSGKPWPIRSQEWCEVITHEFWWTDGVNIGFTYQDRRGDSTIEDLPWAEYAPRPTQLGIADPSGKQLYLSDPVNHYHTHLYCSLDGRLISGSGTDGHSFVYAAPFDWHSPRVDFIPLATIHTPYVPFRGQGVNCDFSADGKWLLFSDTVGKERQLCAVAVELS